MKRIICLILALLMLVSLVACGGTNPPEDTSGDQQSENTPTEVAPYTGEFKVGFSRVVITPTEAQMKSAGYNRVDSELTATYLRLPQAERERLEKEKANNTKI